MTGFYWLVESEIAGSPRPWSEADLEAWRRQGIRAVVSLVEDRLDFAGFDVLHLPVPDMTPPVIAQLDEARRFIDDRRAAGRPVVVHCFAGKGRTGTVLAAWLISRGASVESAMAHVRSRSPGSIETPEQELVLVEFASKAH